MNGNDWQEATRRLAMNFLRALEAEDEIAVRRLYAPGARIWHNFDGKTQSVDENVRMLHWLHGRLQGVRYAVQRLVPFDGGYLQQHVLRGTLPDGEAFALPACVVCEVEDGRIASLEEYLDLSQTAPLMEE